MDWEDLRVFVTFARAGTLMATAKQLRMDHTTVGRRIAHLERDLGVRLLERLPRGVRMTADGTRVAALGEAVEEGTLAVERMARAGQDGDRIVGTVRINAPPHFAATFLAPRLGALRAVHPDLRIELTGHAFTVNLARHEADIAVRLTRPEGNSLVARRVGLMGYRLYGTRAYLERVPRVDWDFIGFDETLAHLPQQRWMDRIAAGRMPAIRSNEQAVQEAAIAAGLGVGVLPCCFVPPGSALVVIPIAPLPPPRELWLAAHGDLLRDAGVRAAFDFLVSLATAETALLLGPTS